MTVRRWGIVVGVALILGLAAVRSFPAAGEGAVLVLRDRVVAGPARAMVAPWSSRRAIKTPEAISWRTSVDLGQGSVWPAEIAVDLTVDAGLADREARDLLLERDGLAGAVRRLAEDGLPRIARGLGAGEVLANPKALSAPLREVVGEGLPRGIAVTSAQVLLVSTAGQASSAVASAARAAATEPIARVLYVGLDGADWEIVRAMIAKGELPTLARLVREGARANLVAYEPLMSPLLWTTAVTGRAPDEHGIADFTLTRDGEDQVPIDATHRKVPSLWEILAAAGQPSAFVNFWATHPAEQVPGVLVSDVAPGLIAEGSPRPPLPAGTTWPPDAVDAMWGEFWSTETIPAAEVRRFAPALDGAAIDRGRRFWRDAEMRQRWKEANEGGRRSPPEAFLVKVAAETHNTGVILERLLRRPELGVVAGYFEAIDLIGHSFQHLAPPPHPLAPPAERALYAGTVEACYRVQDEILGRLVAAAGSGTLVIIHSDHGFTSGARRPMTILPFTQGQPVEWHRRTGVFLAWGGPARSGEEAAPVTLYDIAPTILAVRGVPPAESMRGHVRADLLRPGAASALVQKRVANYDALVASRSYGDVTEESLAEAQERLLESLRGLGYIADPEIGRAKDESASPATASTRGAKPRPGVTYYRNLATWFMNEQRYGEAEGALLEANRLKPLPKSYWLLSESRAARDDLDGAITALEDGYREFPDKMTPASVLWLVELHIKKGDLGGARAALERHREATRAQPSVALLAEARLVDVQGNAEDARRRYLATLASDPREARAAQRFAALARTPEERRKLLPYLERALRQDPRIEIYWQMRGLIFGEAGDLQAAATSFLRAAELDPDDERLQAAAASAAMRAGRGEDARRILEGLVRVGSREPSVWVNLGSLRASSGDWNGALEAWERAVELGAEAGPLSSGMEEARRRVGRSAS